MLGLLILCGFASAASATPRDSAREVAVNVITYSPWGFRVDATPQGARVQRLFQKIKTLGVNTLIFNFRGRMIKGTSSDINSDVPADAQIGRAHV